MIHVEIVARGGITIVVGGNVKIVTGGGITVVVGAKLLFQTRTSRTLFVQLLACRIATALSRFMIWSLLSKTSKTSRSPKHPTASSITVPLPLYRKEA
jgi:hypothetical protein